MEEKKYPQTFQNTIWTYKAYCDLPADGKIYQIIKGVLYVTPSPSFNHQEVLTELLNFLKNFISENDLGKIVPAPMDVIFSETDIVQPDILFIKKDRRAIITDRGVEGAPDLVVEVISPSTGTFDEERKRDLYEDQGVHEYLIVYPKEKKVVQYVLQGGFFQKKGTFLASEEMKLYSLPTTMPLDRIFSSSSE